MSDYVIYVNSMKKSDFKYLVSSDVFKNIDYFINSYEYFCVGWDCFCDEHHLNLDDIKITYKEWVNLKNK